MKHARFTSLLALSIPDSASALIGYGISMYKPNCAFACRASFESAMLECSSHEHSSGHSHGTGPTSPECYASDTAWLTTLAYCINSTCADYGVEAWEVEKYWADKCTNDAKVAPKWTYAETLTELGKMDGPVRSLGEEEMLDFTAVYDGEIWERHRGTLNAFENAESTHSLYSITLLVLGFTIPIFFTLLNYLPFMSTIYDKLKPNYIYPALIPNYHVQPLPFHLGNAPTLGQTWYILLFFILNIIFTATGHRSYQPSTWFATPLAEMMAYISNRTGVLAFALAPLTILFSGRNNILLWLTNWSHSTYMLLHRWVARIFALQVLLHSILELAMYHRTGTLAAEQTQPYWIWGVVATLAVVLMVVLSALYIRRLSYEAFLITHILLAVFVIAGSWYHVDMLFERRWGYEFWLYAACAVWFFDRVMRVGRMLKNGMRRAVVTEIGADVVRIDVAGVRWDALPGRHTYAYFPGLNWMRPWENHPFSVIPTAMLISRGPGVTDDGQTSLHNHNNDSDDIEKIGATTRVSSFPKAARPGAGAGGSTSGISLYIRKSHGTTKALQSSQSLLTLLDGPYPNTSPTSVLKTDRLILIAGGIGITGTLPFILHHTNVKLYWSVKSTGQALVRDLKGVLDGLSEKEVLVGRRLDVERVLGEVEGEGWKRIRVVVCGPGGLCDGVRGVVSRRGREGRVVWELSVEAFSW